jgi:hypothetical protein
MTKMIGVIGLITGEIVVNHVSHVNHAISNQLNAQLALHAQVALDAHHNVTGGINLARIILIIVTLKNKSYPNLDNLLQLKMHAAMNVLINNLLVD